MLFFWILSTWLLLNIFDKDNEKKQVNWALVFLGLTIGMAIMGKVHAVFLWLGTGIYILLFYRKMLANVYLYVSILISLIIISPILFWNIENDFITYKFQGARVVANSGLHLDSFLTELVGGMLYNNPINYILIIIALIGLVTSKITPNQAALRLMFCLSIPLIISLLIISAFRSTLPHWSGPAHVLLSVIAASYLAKKNSLLYNNILKGSNFFIFLIAVIAAIFINFYPGTIGSTDEKKFGEDDLTLELFGWKKFNKQFEKIRKQDIANGLMPEKSIIVCNKWFPGGHINYYVARPNDIDLVGIGELNELHHFNWLNQVRSKLKPGDDAYIIAPSNYSYALNVPNFYGAYFETIETPLVIEQYRNGKKVRNFELYRARNYRSKSIN